MATLILLVMLIVSVSASAPAAYADEDHPINNSDGYTYTVLKDGTVEITRYSGTESDLIIGKTSSRSTKTTPTISTGSAKTVLSDAIH